METKNHSVTALFILLGLANALPPSTIFSTDLSWQRITAEDSTWQQVKDLKTIIYTIDTAQTLPEIVRCGDKINDIKSRIARKPSVFTQTLLQFAEWRYKRKLKNLRPS